MGPGEREYRQVMIEGAIGGTGRVAGEAGSILVKVTAHPLVLFVHIALVMLMAYGAAVECVILGIGMAFIARIPFPIMCSGIDWEIQSVMLTEFGRSPSGSSGMALRAIGGESGSGVVGHLCGQVV